MDAVAVFDTELRAMGRANDYLVAGIKELIRQPVEIDAGMRAPVEIAIQPAVEQNDKYIQIPVAGFDGKTFCRICGQLLPCA